MHVNWNYKVADTSQHEKNYRPAGVSQPQTDQLASKTTCGFSVEADQCAVCRGSLCVHVG